MKTADFKTSMVSKDSRKPMSLRWRLLLLLVVTAIIISALLFFTMRNVTTQAVQATQDALLETAALSILEQTRTVEDDVEVDLPYNTFTMLGATSEDKVYYRIDLDGAFLTGYEDLVPNIIPQEEDRLAFSSITFRGNKLRQATIHRGFVVRGTTKFVRITIAQTQLFQETIIRDISRSASIIGISFFGFAIFMALLVTTSFLRPIKLLADAVSRRGPNDLRPVKHPTPEELTPLVLSLNGFIARLRTTLRQTETFIAEAAHHIRTPLSLVKSESQLALSKSTSPDDREHLRNIIQAVDQSSRSASQLLDHAIVLYRAEQADELRLDLTILIQNLIENIQPAASLKDINIVSDLDSTSPIFIMADQVLVEVALRNMLDNAIKYSQPDQTIFVTLSVANNMAKTSVKDQGRGLEGINQRELKQRFKRGSNVDDVIGSGLGLAIVWEICSSLSGKFTLKNNKGNGACAILYLPVC
ncbi:sensor histidine kinase [Alphaproteobacteria bacterium]|nr:sensor histidine kinase [Alphaproteobacteria bacterium]